MSNLRDWVEQCLLYHLVHKSQNQLWSHLVHHFWNQWSEEYLTSLTRQNQWYRQTRNLDVVLLKEDGIVPTAWPIWNAMMDKNPDQLHSGVAMRFASLMHQFLDRFFD